MNLSLYTITLYLFIRIQHRTVTFSKCCFIATCPDLLFNMFLLSQRNYDTMQHLFSTAGRSKGFPVVWPHLTTHKDANIKKGENSFKKSTDSLTLDIHELLFCTQAISCWWGQVQFNGLHLCSKSILSDFVVDCTELSVWKPPKVSFLSPKLCSHWRCSTNL